MTGGQLMSFGLQFFWGGRGERREELRIGDGDGIRGGHLLAREGLQMRKPFRIETDGNRGS